MYANVCFDPYIDVDIKPYPEKECADDEICFYDKTVNTQADGSLKTDTIVAHCISKGAKPADYEIGKCKTRKLSGTATQKRECFCDCDRCNSDDQSAGNCGQPPQNGTQSSWHHGYTAGIVGGIVVIIVVAAIAIFKHKKKQRI